MSDIEVKKINDVVAETSIAEEKPVAVVEEKPVAVAEAEAEIETEPKSETEAKPAEEEIKIELSAYYPRAIGKPTSFFPIRNASGVSQTSPPTMTIQDFYEGARMPLGQIMEHNLDSNTYRTTSAELREKDLFRDDEWNEVREAAEAHRQTRYHLHNVIRPGMSLMEITRIIEKSNLNLLGVKGPGDLKRGYGFPTGVSINHVAAHFSPNTGDKTILQENDVLKVDYGTHIGGRIIDSAFTVHFNPVYDPLAEAVKEATNAGIKAAGIDMRLGDIGGVIQEVMESYEVEMNGKILPVKCIRNLNGHNIEKYRIHGGKTVPCVNNGDQTKMEENEFFAIETFGTTGRGAITEDGECSHYMRNPAFKGRPRGPPSVAKLFNFIEKKFSTLPFCRKWLDDMGETKHSLALHQLVRQGIYDAYPPLVDVKGSYTAQFEHTILLRPNAKEVLSRGYDY